MIIWTSFSRQPTAILTPAYVLKSQISFPRKYICHISNPNQLNLHNYSKSRPKSHKRPLHQPQIKNYTWLHCKEEKDAVYCFDCLKDSETKSLSTQFLFQANELEMTKFRNCKMTVKTPLNLNYVVDMISTEATITAKS